MKRDQSGLRIERRSDIRFGENVRMSPKRNNGGVELAEQNTKLSLPENNDKSTLIATSDFSRNTILEILSNQRRRFTIHYLKQKEGDHVTVSELADRVASWENNKEIDQLSHQERKRVRNALRQFHLPKMADEEFVEYDSRRGTVTLSEAVSDANFYIDSLTGGKIPWGFYYLGLSTLSAICLIGLWAGMFPFTLLSPFSYNVFLVTALTISSIGHYYDNYYRMRLGAREKPPEVGSE